MESTSNIIMENFVSYEMAVELKSIGFNEKCFGYFSEKKFYIIGEPFDANKDNGDYINLQVFSAPLLQQVFKWFRDKYHLKCEIVFNEDDFVKGYVYHGEIYTLDYNYFNINGVHDQVDVLKNKIKTTSDMDIEDELHYLDIGLDDDDDCFDTYEETEIACLKQLIEMAKQNK